MAVNSAMSPKVHEPRLQMHALFHTPGTDHCVGAHTTLLSMNSIIRVTQFPVIWLGISGIPVTITSVLGTTAGKMTEQKLGQLKQRNELWAQPTQAAALAQ